jgi:hypothetical protein
MHIFHQILSLLNQVPQGVWDMIIQVVMSAVTVSPIGLALKKWWNIESEKIMLSLVMFASVAAPALLYLKSDPQFAGWIVLVEGGLVFATTQPVYYFFVKPLGKKMGTWFGGELAKAASIKQAQEDIKSALEPAGGLKLTPDPVSAAAVASTQVEKIKDFR